VCSKVAIPVNELKQPTKVTRFSDGTTFTAITTHTDTYKFSFFPRTIREWNSLTHHSRLTWIPTHSCQISHNTPAVKGYAHCWVHTEELKNSTWSEAVSYTPRLHLIIASADLITGVCVAAFFSTTINMRMENSAHDIYLSVQDGK